MHKDKDPETSLERTYQPLRLADETCPECHGYGYAVLLCDGLEHPPAELQAVDACPCLERRVLDWPLERLADSRDHLAAVAFVQDLEAGRAYAIDCAAELVEATAPEPDAETTAEPDAPLEYPRPGGSLSWGEWADEVLARCIMTRSTPEPDAPAISIEPDPSATGSELDPFEVCRRIVSGYYTASKSAKQAALHALTCHATLTEGPR